MIGARHVARTPGRQDARRSGPWDTNPSNPAVRGNGVQSEPALHATTPTTHHPTIGPFHQAGIPTSRHTPACLIQGYSACPDGARAVTPLALLVSSETGPLTSFPLFYDGERSGTSTAAWISWDG